MANSIRFSYCLSIFLLLVSCNNTNQLDGVDYLNEVHNDKDLIKIVELQDWRFIANYRPLKEVVIQEINSESFSQEKMDSLLEQKKGLVHFNMQCRHSKYENRPFIKLISKNYNEYNTWFQYYSYEAKQDFKLSYHGEEIYPLAYHLEANYGLAPYDQMMLVFRIPDSEPKEDMTLTYTDRALNLGKINFHYPIEGIKKL